MPSEKPTTIQVSEELRRYLKLLASYRDMSYEELISDLLKVFESEVKFKSEKEFAVWFEKNYNLFGFSKIITKGKGVPDYVMQTYDGKNKNVKLELIGENSLQHDMNLVDIIICVYSSKEKIGGKPVFALNKIGKLMPVTGKIAISLSPLTIKKVDRIIEKGTYRNRSHAIENILLNHLDDDFNTAIIFAGGPLIRLNEKEVPKALVIIGNTTVLEHQINFLKKYGFEKIIISADEKNRKIKNAISKYPKNEIVYFEEKKPMGTAGSISLLRDFIDGTFAVINVDTLLDVDINEIYKCHKDWKRMATMLVVSMPDPTNFGVVNMSGNSVVRFQEKPKQTDSYIVNGGFYIFDEAILDLVPKHKFMMEELLQSLANKSQLTGFIHSGVVFDVGSHDGYERAIKEWKQAKLY